MNRFIIADATKCIGCRTCEVACAVSHQENQDCAALSPDEFISRIRVIKDHSWTTAVACHQCEDAPCANVCPVDAISREHGHIFVEQTRCIGCKSCMLACPFGAMEVVSSRKNATPPSCPIRATLIQSRTFTCETFRHRNRRFLPDQNGWIDSGATT